MQHSGKHAVSLIALLGVVLCFVACKKDYFDQERYEELVNTIYPISDIDAHQRWNTISSKICYVVANANLPDVEKVMVLTGDPTKDNEVSILAEAKTSKGANLNIGYNVGYATEYVYFACVSTNGECAVRRVSVKLQNITFLDDFLDSKGQFRASIMPYWYTFCFDQSFPNTEDFDFNDVVLRTSLQNISDTKIQLNVELAAVGSIAMLGAAIRLNNTTDEEVERITCTKPFFRVDDNMNNSVVPQADDNGYVLARHAKNIRGKYDIVIPLFADAHVAITNGECIDNSQYVQRKFINTVRDEEFEGEYQDVTSTPVASYIIEFKNEEAASQLSIRDIDAFIVTGINTTYWEVHTYPFKTSQVLHGYITKAGNYSDNKIWALLIPGKFGHPQETYPLGYFKGNRLTGAYKDPGHSFPEWAQNSEVAKDWYVHPTKQFIY